MSLITYLIKANNISIIHNLSTSIYETKIYLVSKEFAANWPNIGEGESF
jgi:hypothetical protein